MKHVLTLFQSSMEEKYHGFWELNMGLLEEQLVLLTLDHLFSSWYGYCFLVNEI